MTGLDLIKLARSHQLEKGYTPEHDLEHSDGSLVRAARCYAEHARLTAIFGPDKAWTHEATTEFADNGYCYPSWPWNIESFRADSSDPIKDLAKAGALIAAEIDRLLAEKDMAQ